MKQLPRLMAGIFLALAFMVPLAAQACPDIIVCKNRNPISPGGSAQEVGRFSWPTCYKFGHGCRPRHCDNARNLSDDYWDRECKKRFPNKCDKPSNNNGNPCWAEFPGAIVQ